jgi:hypothetical protein
MQEHNNSEHPPKEPAPMGSMRELGEVAVGFVSAAARMVGRDVLHVLHIKRKDRFEDLFPRTAMTDEEVRNWNITHGYPPDWRN